MQNQNIQEFVENIVETIFLSEELQEGNPNLPGIHTYLEIDNDRYIKIEKLITASVLIHHLKIISAKYLNYKDIVSIFHKNLENYPEVFGFNNKESFNDSLWRCNYDVSKLLTMSENNFKSYKILWIEEMLLKYYDFNRKTNYSSTVPHIWFSTILSRINMIGEFIYEVTDTKPEAKI